MGAACARHACAWAPHARSTRAHGRRMHGHMGAHAAHAQLTLKKTLFKISNFPPGDSKGGMDADGEAALAKAEAEVAEFHKK